MSNKMVGGASGRPDAREAMNVVADIATKIGNRTISLEEAKRFAKRENPFSPARISKKLRSEWQRFYRDVLGMDIDLSDVRIPDNPGGFYLVIIVAQGLTIAKIVAAMRQRFEVSLSREDLDDAVPENERAPANGSYAIRVRERVEADEELKNLSGDDIRSRSQATMTLLERLLYELKYFSERGAHLDVANITLCAGSRYRDGDVPDVDWYGVYGRLCVSACSASHRGDSLRPRAVVS